MSSKHLLTVALLLPFVTISTVAIGIGVLRGRRIASRGMAFVAHRCHFTAVAAVEALSDGGRRLRRAQVKSRFLAFGPR